MWDDQLPAALMPAGAVADQYGMGAGRDLGADFLPSCSTLFLRDPILNATASFAGDVWTFRRKWSGDFRSRFM